MNIDPKIGILIGGVITFIGTAITVYYSYQNNVKSSEKSSKTLSNTEIGLKNDSDLKEQNDNLTKLNSDLHLKINHLQEENLDLHRKLEQKSNTIINNLTGGDSYPLLVYSYDRGTEEFSVKAILEGDNPLVISRIDHINLTGEKRYLEKNPPLDPWIVDPRIRNKWSQGLSIAKYAPELKTATLLKDNPQEILVNWDNVFLIHSSHNYTLEAKIFTQNKLFIQTTALSWYSLQRRPQLVVMETTVSENGEVIYHKKNN